MNKETAEKRLTELINGSPKNIKLGKKDWKITPLKTGTKWLICQEAQMIDENCKDADSIIVEMGKSLPTVVKCIALLLLNDKEKINNNLDELVDVLTWSDLKPEEVTFLFESVFQMLDISFFFHITDNLKMLLRETTKIKNQRLSQLEQSGVK